MNIVLFLGAGYSAAYDFPIMNEFLSFADSSQKIDKDDKDFIGRLVLEARRANSFLQSSPTNLEDILSFSVMADRLAFNKEENGSHNYRIRKILQKIFTQVNYTRDFWSKFDNFKSFLSFNPQENNKHNLSIITTNYDLCIECSLLRLGLFTNPGFAFTQIKDNKKLISVDKLYSPNGIPVFKLHGSVNWFETKSESNYFDVEERVVGIQGHFNNSERNVLPYSCVRDYYSDEPPVIIPPSFLKPDLKGPLENIWKGASEKLKQANIIVFVGYSFPMTDTEMMYFFARSLTDNSTLRLILLVDPFANEIKERINSSLKFGTHFKDLLKTYPKKWETTNLSKYLERA
jgi:hypothetical protein